MTIVLQRTQPPPVDVRQLLDEITNPTFEVEDGYAPPAVHLPAAFRTPKLCALQGRLAYAAAGTATRSRRRSKQRRRGMERRLLDQDNRYPAILSDYCVLHGSARVY